MVVSICRFCVGKNAHLNSESLVHALLEHGERAVYVMDAVKYVLTGSGRRRSARNGS